MNDGKLTLLVQVYPALYDLSHKDQGNNLMKDNKWQQIPKEMDGLVNDCKDKWKLLRAYYR